MKYIVFKSLKKEKLSGFMKNIYKLIKKSIYVIANRKNSFRLLHCHWPTSNLSSIIAVCLQIVIFLILLLSFALKRKQ